MLPGYADWFLHLIMGTPTGTVNQNTMYNLNQRGTTPAGMFVQTTLLLGTLVIMHIAVRLLKLISVFVILDMLTSKYEAYYLNFILSGGGIFRHYNTFHIIFWSRIKKRAYSVICCNKLPVDCVLGSRERSSWLFYFPNTVKCIVIGWYTGGPSNDLPPAVLPPLVYSGLAPQ